VCQSCGEGDRQEGDRRVTIILRSAIPRFFLVVMALVLSLGSLAPSSAFAASSRRVESSSGGGATDCQVLQISELLATYTKGSGGHAFVDLSMADTCAGPSASTVASGTLARGDLKGTLDRMRLRTRLIDEAGWGTRVRLNLVFTCWQVQDVSESGSSCLATMSGKVTVNGTLIVLDPSTDASMSIAK
jgi:hypothetical protein